MEIKEQEVVRGVYKNVHFEILKWKTNFMTDLLPEYIWNYYIYVKPRDLMGGIDNIQRLIRNTPSLF